MKKNPENCRHEYIGDHEEWTCPLCGDEQNYVPYFETLQGRLAVQRMEKAKDDLLKTLSDDRKGAIRAGFNCALRIVEDCQSLNEAKQALQDLLDSDWPDSKGLMA